MGICKKCGNKVETEFLFCPFCGKRQFKTNNYGYEPDSEQILEWRKKNSKRRNATYKQPSYQKSLFRYADDLASFAEEKEQAYLDDLYANTSAFVLTAIEAYEEYKREAY